MADQTKKQREKGLDYLQAHSAEKLLEQIEAAGAVKVISIYAVHSIHFAWIERGNERTDKPEKGRRKD